MNQAFIDACNFLMPFGQFRGQRLAQIGLSDRGLSYLDWLSRQEMLAIHGHDALKAALKTYLEHPAMGAAVEATIEY